MYESVYLAEKVRWTGGDIDERTKGRVDVSGGGVRLASEIMAGEREDDVLRTIAKYGRWRQLAWYRDEAAL